MHADIINNTLSHSSGLFVFRSIILHQHLSVLSALCRHSFCAFRVLAFYSRKAWNFDSSKTCLFPVAGRYFIDIFCPSEQVPF